jgi:hypothetical protein
MKEHLKKIGGLMQDIKPFHKIRTYEIFIHTLSSPLRLLLTNIFIGYSQPFLSRHFIRFNELTFG